MVHDWVFLARQCLNDNKPTDEERKVAAMSFQDSADLIAEAIKALIVSGRVKSREIAPRVIAGVVAGPIANRRWTARGACARVDPDHVKEVNAALARKTGIMALGVPGVAPAQIVAEFDF